MKKIIIAALALAGLLFSSCDRTGNFEVFEKEIPWNFCVKVSTDDAHLKVVSGATVQIFKSEEDRDAQKNVFLTKTTDANGEALFTLAEFDPQNKGGEFVKGVYYLRVAKGSDVKTENTRYLLMNSGTTYHYAVFN